MLDALLHAVQRDVFATRRYATISLCLYDDDPLLEALNAWWHVAVPMDLFWVDVVGIADADGSAPPRIAKERYPGFESYLV